MDARVAALLSVVLCGCGRIGFDTQSMSDAACVGAQCAPACTTDCFPLELARGSALPAFWGSSAAALPTGEVHLSFIEPTTGAVMWQYSDRTLKRWSAPVVLSDGVAGPFEQVKLILHQDDSLTALMLDYDAAGGASIYRRLVSPVSPAVWNPDAAPAQLALPPMELYHFDAVADRGGTGGFIVAISVGDGSTTGDAIFGARSNDKFQTITGITTAGPGESLITSTPPLKYYEVRVAVDGADSLWVYYHERVNTSDDGALLRYVTGAWQRVLPAWGDPWHPCVGVDDADTLQAFFAQEGTNNNPQHASATTLATVTGGAGIGDWQYASLPSGAQLRSALATEGGNMRLLWENPESSNVSLRSLTGATLGALHPDVLAALSLVSDGTGAALTVAPRMVAGTSHLMWRDQVGPGVYAWRYAPVTECGGILCAFDEACEGGPAGVCVTR